MFTPRDRILATLNHQTPDRIPTEGWFHHEVMAKLKEHFGTGDWHVVEHELGIEGWACVGIGLRFGDYHQRTTPRPDHCDGRRAVWLDRRTYEDPWGVRFRLDEHDRYEQWLSGPLQDAETADDIACLRMPQLDDVHEPEGLAEQVEKLKELDYFVSGGVENPFKRYWHLRGFENALADYLIKPELLRAAYDHLFSLSTDIAVRLTRAGVDMIKVVGDIAMQDRVLMGPDLWREYDKRYWAYLIDLCRQNNPDVHFFFHSDGDLTGVMDDLIEVGFDVINPIQPECMDPYEAHERWGDRATMHGCVSIQRTLPFGTPAEVEREVKDLIDHCGRDGGLVLMPSNVIQPDTPVENIIACFHTARDTDPRAV